MERLNNIIDETNKKTKDRKKKKEYKDIEILTTELYKQKHMKKLIEKIIKNRGNTDDCSDEYIVKKQQLAGFKDKLSIFLCDDLNKFILAFELYICFIERDRNRFIKNKLNRCNFKLFNLKKLSINRVLSFNYTDTYRKLYAEDLLDKNIDFVHGKAGKNNLVIGIDENLTKENNNQNEKFDVFEKPFQRIYKNIDLKFRKWFENIDSEHPVKVYIIGHSLNEIDKYILSDIILREGITTTIYYGKVEKNKKDKETKKAHITAVRNIRKIIGGDKFKEMIDSADPKISFENLNSLKRECEVKQQEQ